MTSIIDLYAAMAAGFCAPILLWAHAVKNLHASPDLIQKVFRYPSLALALITGLTAYTLYRSGFLAGLSFGAAMAFSLSFIRSK